jgi:hypothetical protein
MDNHAMKILVDILVMKSESIIMSDFQSISHFKRINDENLRL